MTNMTDFRLQLLESFRTPIVDRADIVYDTLKEHGHDSVLRQFPHCAQIEFNGGCFQVGVLNIVFVKPDGHRTDHRHDGTNTIQDFVKWCLT